jgi:hypothetical protein
MSASNDDVITIPDDDAPVRDMRDEVILADPDGDAPAALVQPDGLPPGARLQDDGSIIYKLVYPVTLKWQKGADITEERFTELHLHRLTGEHMLRIGNTGEGGNKAIVTMSCSTRLSHARVTALFNRMDALDVNNSSEALGFLLGIGRKTGR